MTTDPILADRNAVAEEYAHEEFPYEEIFNRLDGPDKEQLAAVKRWGDLAHGLRENLRWCFKTDTNRLRDTGHAFLRFVALTAVLFPEAFEGMSYHEIGKRVGVGKACLSKLALRFSDDHKVKFSRSRDSARRNCKEPASGDKSHWHKNGGKDERPRKAV